MSQFLVDIHKHVVSEKQRCSENLLSVALAELVRQDSESRCGLAEILELKDLAEGDYDALVQFPLRAKNGRYLGRPDIVLRPWGADGGGRDVAIEVKDESAFRADQVDRYARGVGTERVRVIVRRRRGDKVPARWKPQAWTWGDVLGMLLKIELSSPSQQSLRQAYIGLLGRVGAEVAEPAALIPTASLRANDVLLEAASSAVREATYHLLGLSPTTDEDPQSWVEGRLDWSLEPDDEVVLPSTRNTIGLEIAAGPVPGTLLWKGWIYAETRSVEWKAAEASGWRPSDELPADRRKKHEGWWETEVLLSRTATTDISGGLSRACIAFMKLAKDGWGVKLRRPPTDLPLVGASVGQIASALEFVESVHSLLHAQRREWRDAFEKALAALGADGWERRRGRSHGPQLKHVGNQWFLYFESVTRGEPRWQLSIYAGRKHDFEDVAGDGLGVWRVGTVAGSKHLTLQAPLDSRVPWKVPGHTQLVKLVREMTRSPAGTRR
jgi:hypothetical protein